MSPADRRRADEFAALLEGTRTAEGHQLESLVDLAASLRRAPQLDELTAPRADFRAALRERLLAEAAARPPRAIPAQRAPSDPSAPPIRQRVRRLVATGVAVGLLAGTGTAAASTHSVPGDALYGIKRGLESVELSLARSDLSRGRELLEQADSRLSEAESLAASAGSRSATTTQRLATALAEMDAATRSGAEALNSSYADTGDSEALTTLDRFVVKQRPRLADLNDLVDPALRPRLLDLADLLASLQTTLDALLTSASSAAPAGRPSGVSDTAVQPSGGTGGADSGRPAGGADQLGGAVTGGAATVGAVTGNGGAVAGAGGTVNGVTGAGAASGPASPGSAGAGAGGASVQAGSSGGVLGGGAVSASPAAPPASVAVPVPVPVPAVPTAVVVPPAPPSVTVTVPPPPVTGGAPLPAPTVSVSVSLPAPPCVPTPVTPC
jgi:hypothetical protein